MNNNKIIILIIILFILVALSSFFSATETAYTSINETRLKKRAEKNKCAKKALVLSHNFNDILSTLLIGNNIVNITAASISTIVFSHFFGDAGVTISTIVLTIIILVFSEITPKTIAKEKPEVIAELSAYPIMVLKYIFYPLIYLFNLWKKMLNKVFNLGGKKQSITEDEFKYMVVDIEDEGIINEVEKDLILNSLSFDETRIFKVMVPFDKIISASIDSNKTEICAIFEERNISRLPIYNKSKDNIIGLLYRADYYESLSCGTQHISPLLHPVMWTRSDIKISALLRRMQSEKQHMAIVKRADIVVGLVTLDDLLEELVGEIEDKYDAVHL